MDKRRLSRKSEAHGFSDINLSGVLLPHELQSPLHITDHTIDKYNDTTLQNIFQNESLAESMLRTNEDSRKPPDNLFMEFMEVLQTRTSIFETVSDFARCCDDTLKLMNSLNTTSNANSRMQEHLWLINERNIWKLLFCLYQNRLNNQSNDEDTEAVPYFGNSEKLCVDSLYRRNALLRESQLVIDWLENIGDDEEDDLNFFDRTSGWENTLHQLESPETIVFKSTRDIITRMDPDAPFREGLDLHDLDKEDEKRLSKAVFKLIRSGNFEDARKLCVHCGEAWRAAMLEGWRLYHNPNVLHEKYNRDAGEPSQDNKESINVPNTYQGLEIEGNGSRDIWKSTAWDFSSDREIDPFERAAVAAFCGNLEGLLPICVTWKDHLWAYMKTLVDIRVESEIRDFVSKTYDPMPEEYWNNRMSLNAVFDHLQSSKNVNVRMESNSPNCAIQKHIILEETPQLLAHFEKWIDSNSITDQFSRFLAHLVLFFKQIGFNQSENIIDKVLEEYIKRLINMNQTQLIAFYTGTLSKSLQVKLYASYVERIVEYEERKESLRFADEAGLDVHLIAKQVVENVRRKQDPDQKLHYNLQHKITEMDLHKISAIEWILFYESQRAEAIYQVNALIYSYLAIGKIDAARLAFNKIPMNAIETILLSRTEDGSKTAVGTLSSVQSDQLPDGEVERCVREYLCYKAYLDAHEAFSDWYKHFQSKPIPPESIPEGVQFTEKVAYEHKVSQHKANTDRWKFTLTHLAKTAKALLYNILLFPEGGWLVGCSDSNSLRRKYIPEVVLLLFSVLHKTGEHEECIQLADILASEKYFLYKVYSTEKLQEILLKLTESSVALLNEKKDPWGNPTSA